MLAQLIRALRWQRRGHEFESRTLHQDFEFMSDKPFSHWWYYEMYEDAAKDPNRHVSTGGFVVIVVCFVLMLLLLGGFAAVLIWCFT